MYKPLFFTAIMAVAAAFTAAPNPASATANSVDVHSAKQCPQGQIWDKRRMKCVSVPRGSY